MKSFILNKKMIAIIVITTITIMLIKIPIVKAIEGDASGGSHSYKGYGTSDVCLTDGICWRFFGSSSTMMGIRVSIVDSTGAQIGNFKDYFRNEAVVNNINNTKGYFRQSLGSNKISYLLGKANYSDNWITPNDTKVAIHWSGLPDLTQEKTNELRQAILNMNENALDTQFFSQLGYKYNNYTSKQRENHYLIIEPVIVLATGNKNTNEIVNYYGTYYELNKVMNTSKIQALIQASIIDKTKFNYFLKSAFPYSIYITGNIAIQGDGGYNSTNSSYFSGKINAINEDSCIQKYSHTNNKYIKSNCDSENYGWGMGIFWIPQLITESPKCDYNNPSHFNTTSSGPNGEDCCEYVIDNLSEYNITKSQLFAKHSRCQDNIAKKCTFDLTISKPTCTTSGYGKIADITDWQCIYASTNSNDQVIKNYFLKYKSSTCSVYCRDEIEYFYPGSGMTALAGNYFTISQNISSYYSYLEESSKLTKIKAATLGPVKMQITRECSILGTANSTCIAQREEQLNKISSPQLEFAYESKYYNNPNETLTAKEEVSKENTINQIKSKSKTYFYYLPESTYKYVSKKTGISYKLLSQLGKQEYISIEKHLPIHFSEENKTIPFQIAIKKFNLPNFDKLVLGNQTMATKFITSIETYIQNLMEEGRFTPQEINGMYYLNQTFIELLKKNNYTEDNFLKMSCANTSAYTCSSNSNGIYCLNKNQNYNTLTTYDELKKCITIKVDDLTKQINQKSYQNNMLYTCDFRVKGIDDTGTNVIYRPISLNDPFPGKQGNGRDTGYNWCYDGNCDSKNNIIVESIIKNNRGVETEKIYNELSPLYTITLNPAVIKKIREYNDKNTYDDFNLTCNNGLNCKSNFIRDKFKEYFSGCGISNKKVGLKCQTNDAW